MITTDQRKNAAELIQYFRFQMRDCAMLYRRLINPKGRWTLAVRVQHGGNYVRKAITYRNHARQLAKHFGLPQGTSKL